MITVRLVGVEGMSGMIDASTTRSPLRPLTAPTASTARSGHQRHMLTHDATSAVEVRHRAGEKSSPDSSDLLGYADRVQPSTAPPGLIHRHAHRPGGLIILARWQRLLW